MDTPKSAVVTYLIDNDIAAFEQMVLTVLARDRDFFARAGRILCPVIPGTKDRLRDFKDDLNTAVYEALEAYYQVFGLNATLIPESFAIAALQRIAGSARGVIGPDEVQQALQRLEAVKVIDVATVKPMVLDGFVHWLTKGRTFAQIKAAVARTDWDPLKLINDIKMQVASVGLLTQKETFFEYGHGLDNRILDVARVPIPNLTGLTKALGGGLGWGEAYLFVAPQGAGKTILGCQLASTLCEQVRQTGIYITTEQGHHELEPRIVSNRCKVPYSMIMDGFDPRTLNPEAQKEYEAHRAAIKGRLFWEDWNGNDRSRTIAMDLVDVVHRRQDELGRKVDFLIFDWIGSALGKLSKNDMDKLRIIYQDAADTIANIARDENMITIAFAQVMMGAAVNKKRVDASMISECKSMGNNFTGVIGITAMFLDGQVPDGDDEPIWDPRQFFYISKARKGTGGCTPFYRAFEYQRMADINTRPRPGA